MKHKTKYFIIYNMKKKILRTGSCPDKDFFLQVGDEEFVKEGKANGLTQKIEFDGFDEKGQPINPRVVGKTPEEIEADDPRSIEIPFEKRIANITNEQLQDVLKRLDDLEKR